MFSHARPKLPNSSNSSSSSCNPPTTSLSSRFPKPTQVTKPSLSSSSVVKTPSSVPSTTTPGTTGAMAEEIITSFLREIAMKKSSEARKSSSNSCGGNGDKKTNLRIKMEYRGEKSCIEMERPVAFSLLKKHLCSKYSRQLNIYYTLSNNELIVPIRNQQELDRAVELLDKSSSQRSLRLLLSQHQSDSGISNCSSSLGSPTNSLQPDASGTYSAVPPRIVEVIDFSYILSTNFFLFRLTLFQFIFVIRNGCLLYCASLLVVVFKRIVNFVGFFNNKLVDHFQISF